MKNQKLSKCTSSQKPRCDSIEIDNRNSNVLKCKLPNKQIDLLLSDDSSIELPDDKELEEFILNYSIAEINSDDSEDEFIKNFFKSPELPKPIYKRWAKQGMCLCPGDHISSDESSVELPDDKVLGEFMLNYKCSAFSKSQSKRLKLKSNNSQQN